MRRILCAVVMTLVTPAAWAQSTRLFPTATSARGDSPLSAGIETATDTLFRGVPQVRLPLAFPDEEGAMLIDIAPRYSIDRGESEWGVGWTADLDIRRVHRSGMVTFTSSDELMSPWGLLEKDAADPNLWRGTGQAFAVRVRYEAPRYVAYLPSLTKIFFEDKVGEGRRWSVVRAETTTGLLQTVSYRAELSADRRPLIDEVEYGGVGSGPRPYRVKFDYGNELRRLDVYVRGALRFAYHLDHPWYSEPLLTSLRKVYASGQEEPAVTFNYYPNTFEQASIQPFPSFTQALNGTLMGAESFAGAASFYQNSQQVAPQLNLLFRAYADLGFPQPEENKLYTIDGGWALTKRPVNTQQPLALIAKAEFFGRGTSPQLLYQTINNSGQGAVLLDPDSAGNYTFHEAASVDPRTNGARFALADVDGDGRIDILYCVPSVYTPPRISALINNGTTLLSSWPAVTLWEDTRAREVEGLQVVELDGDGAFDIVLHQKSVAPVLLRNKGMLRQFEELAFWSVPLPPRTIFMDVNGDKRADAVLVKTRTLAGREVFDEASIIINRGLKRNLAGPAPHTRLSFETAAGFTALSKNKMNHGAVATSLLPVNLINDGRPHLLFLGNTPQPRLDRAFSGNVYDVTINQLGANLLESIDNGQGSRTAFRYAHDWRTGSKVLDTITRQSVGEADVEERYTLGTPVYRRHSFAGYQSVKKVIRPPGGPQRLQETSTFGFTADGDAYLMSTSRLENAPGTHLSDTFFTYDFPGRRIVPRSVQLRMGSAYVQRTDFDWTGDCLVRTRVATGSDRLLDNEILEFASHHPAFAHCQARRQVRRATGVADLNTRLTWDSDGQLAELETGTQQFLLREKRTYNADHTLQTITVPGQGTWTYAYGPAPLVASITGPDGVQTRVDARDALTGRPLKVSSGVNAGTRFEEFVDYDGHERTERLWTSLHGSREQPLRQYAYQLPRFGPQPLLGRMDMLSLVDADSGASVAQAAMINGSGETVLSAMRVADGWIFGADLIDRVSGLQRRRIVTPSKWTANTPLPQTIAAIEAVTHDVATLQSSALGTNTTQKTTYAADSHGEVRITQAGEGGRVRTIIKDIASGTQREVLSSIDGLPYELVNELGAKSTLRYNGLNQLTDLITPNFSYTMGYDAYGRRTHVQYVSSVLPTLRVEYLYDARSGLLERKAFLSGGVAVRYEFYLYDAFGRVKTVAHTDGERRHAKMFAYLYDGRTPEDDQPIDSQRGFLTGIVGPEFSKRFLYRGDGSLQEATINVFGTHVARTTLTYFADGTKKSSRVELLTPDTGLAACSQQRIEKSVRLDTFGRLSHLDINGQPFVSVTRDKLGRVAEMRQGDGHRVQLAYDDKLVFTSVEERKTLSSGEMRISARHINASGKIDREQLTGPSGTQTRSYAYRPDQSLDTVDGDESHGYIYTRGAVSAAVSPAGLRSIHEKLGSIVSTTHPDGATSYTTSYTRDALGRIVSRSGPAGQIAVSYDAQGEVEQSCQGQACARFVYDEEGMRIGRVAANGSRSAMFGSMVVDASGFRSVSSLTSFSSIVSSTTGVETVSTDTRGTPLSGAGTQASMPAWSSPYGERSARPALTEVADFTGHPWEHALGLVRAGVRDYDPELARFWQPDTFLLESPERCIDNLAQCTLFGYGANDPINYVDPDGRFIWWIVATVVAIVASAVAGAVASGGNYVGVGYGGSHDIGGGGPIPPSSGGPPSPSTSVSIGGGPPTPTNSPGGGGAPPAQVPTISAAPPPSLIGQVPLVGSVYRQIDSGVNNVRMGSYSDAAHNFVGAGIDAFGVYGAGGLFKATAIGLFSIGKAAVSAARGLPASSAMNAALLRNQLIAEEIAGGHAFGKHVIRQMEFPGITTRGQFARTIEDFLNHPGTFTRSLSGGRTAYWNDATKTVLIRNPAAADGGTFFSPANGIEYFWGLK